MFQETLSNYTKWNRALWDFLSAGLPLGARLYLSIDDNALRHIGQSENAVSDFEETIRLHCVFNSTVALRRLRHTDTQTGDVPLYLAFLCAMALAAHRMGDDDAHPNDFFLHFNKILGISAEGRPNGLENGAEEELWLAWERWLLQKGYLPTATKEKRYIDYAISQALIRQADRDSLWRYFNSMPSRNPLSEDEVILRLKSEAQRDSLRLTKHLKNLLRQEDERYESVLESIRELYETWLYTEPSERRNVSQTVVRSTLSAGLYRHSDFFSGEVRYLLFPRQPRHAKLTNAVVVRQGEQPLLEERSGWFEPLWNAPVTAQELNEGASYPIKQGGNYRRLNLPKRDFWLLTQDEEGTSVFATWYKRPELGTRIILLCQTRLESLLSDFANEDVLRYQKRALAHLDGWAEYEIRLTSDVAAWNQVWHQIRREEAQVLAQALRPRQNLTLTLSGGLADPQSGSWLTEALPAVTIYALKPRAQFCIKQLGRENDVEIHTASLETGKAHPLPKLSEGTYELVASCDSLSARRILRVSSWDALQPARTCDTASAELPWSWAYG